LAKYKDEECSWIAKCWFPDLWIWWLLPYCYIHHNNWALKRWLSLLEIHFSNSIYAFYTLLIMLHELLWPKANCFSWKIYPLLLTQRNTNNPLLHLFCTKTRNSHCHLQQDQTTKCRKTSQTLVALSYVLFHSNHQEFWGQARFLHE